MIPGQDSSTEGVGQRPPHVLKYTELLQHLRANPGDSGVLLLPDDVGGQFRSPRGAGLLAEQAEEAKGAQPRSTAFRQSRSAVAVFRGTSPVTGRIEWWRTAEMNGSGQNPSPCPHHQSMQPQTVKPLPENPAGDSAQWAESAAENVRRGVFWGITGGATPRSRGGETKTLGRRGLRYDAYTLSLPASSRARLAGGQGQFP